jgi:hypothetical protein
MPHFPPLQFCDKLSITLAHFYLIDFFTASRTAITIPERIKRSCMSFILWESKGFNLSGTPSNATASNCSRPTFLYHAPTMPAIGMSIPVVYEALSLSR